MSIGALDARLEQWMSDADGRLRKPRFAVVLAVIYVLFTATYVSINAYSVGRAAHTLFLPGEERLPFLPIFEYLYVLTYFVAVLLVATVRDYATFRRLLHATGVTLLIAYTTYLLFPVYFERPRLEVTSLHTWLLSLEFMDKPYNHFPSLHVAHSWLAVFASQVSRRSRIGLYVLAAAVSISTLFVKQHYVADVVYGFAVAVMAWRLTSAAKAVCHRVDTNFHDTDLRALVHRSSSRDFAPPQSFLQPSHSDRTAVSEMLGSGPSEYRPEIARHAAGRIRLPWPGVESERGRGGRDANHISTRHAPYVRGSRAHAG
jgi:membrane-associated phospholipid phosphatase